jgi:3-(3-hydroxy-phenyl)propionate hydroxylase
VIVGAGPTGLAAGNLLGMAGIATLIIERNSGVSNIPKAIALDDEGRRICQAMGLSAAMSDCIVSDISIHCVSEGRLLAKVVPLSKRNGYPLISTFYQPEFEAVLLDGLRRFSCVNVRFQHTVETLEQSADGIIVSIHTPTGTLQRVRCTYLLACDGGGSIIRHSLNIPLQGMTFAQKWLVIDSISMAPIRPANALRASFAQAGRKETAPIRPVVKIFCNPQRPAVSIPAPHNGRRLEFMLLPGETEKEMLEPATISALLQQVDAPPHTHTIRQAVYTFHAVLAKTFSQGRVFLLGDAAHMMPPFGGQGLNSGLRDAHNLAWKVAMVLQDQAAPQLLASYHEERSSHAAQMVAFASFLGAIFMSTARPLAFCRNLLIQLLYALPITRQYLMEMRMKPQAQYKAGFFLWKVAGKSLGDSSREEGWRVFKGRDKRMVGSLLPQPEVITPEGQRVLLDEVLGTGFALLRRHPNPEKAFATLKTDFWERLGARFVCIQTADLRTQPNNVRIQTDDVLRIHPDDRCRGLSDVWGGGVALGESSAYQYFAPAADLSARAPHPREQPLPIVVVHAMDNDFLRITQDHYIVVRPDRFILGIFKEEKADLFVSAFQRLLYRHYE